MLLSVKHCEQKLGQDWHNPLLLFNIHPSVHYRHWRMFYRQVRHVAWMQRKHVPVVVFAYLENGWEHYTQKSGLDEQVRQEDEHKIHSELERVYGDMHDVQLLIFPGAQVKQVIEHSWQILTTKVYWVLHERQLVSLLQVSQPMGHISHDVVTGLVLKYRKKKPGWHE